MAFGFSAAVIVRDIYIFIYELCSFGSDDDSACTRPTSSLVVRSLSLRALNGKSSLEFYLWTTAFIQDCFPTRSLISQSQLQLVLTWPSSQPYNHVKALTCAFDTMSLPFLTQLQISTSEHCIDPKTWAKTFGRLPLERVCVQNYAPSFLEALIYKKKEAETSKIVYHAVFPKLRHINPQISPVRGLYRSTCYWIVLWRDVKETQRHGFFVWTIATISRPMMSKDSEKLLLMLSGMERRK